MKRSVVILLACTLGLTSCGKFGKTSPEPKPTGPFGPTGIPPQLRGKTTPSTDNGTPVAPGGNAGSAQGSSRTAFTPENETVYTDMDNPEAEIPELSEVLDSAPRRKGPWELSETLAKQRAIQEGKPLLIWFTDSKTSPMCKALSEELFNRQDFADWAGEKLVRLKVDSNVSGSDFVNDESIGLDEKETRRIDALNYAARLKKRYKVLGSPSLVLLNPGGEVIGQYRGYKRGQSDFTWGLIKQGEASWTAKYESWKSGLEKKGYREWRDRKGRRVFAKLTAYSNGTLVLIQPDGTRYKTEEAKLCDADKAWIAEQKKLRGL